MSFEFKVVIDETERGNNAFYNEEGAAVLFMEMDNIGHFLQSSFTPQNYPKWNVSTVRLTEDELIDHITYNLEGWYVDKCNLDNVSIVNDCVSGIFAIGEEISNHVDKMADKYAFNPNDTESELKLAITDSAKMLKYYLTEQMLNTCVKIYHENH